ncbi:DUF1997 domain-containing protein [Altericista sp. CCNU0014]|uniref:DUF1997 domain-containing protein n=1 Tax=Altericista sp. CCNU0014 TaxID=3082949 RepID=UPI00384F827D
MRATFTASQAVSILVPNAAVPIQHYLRQPHRLVQALTDPSQIEALGQENCYRLKMKPRQFLTFNLQPTVDIRLQPKPDGTVFLNSEACELRGIDFVNQRFHLDLEGVLAPVRDAGKTYLAGQADLKVQVDIPPVLWMTPRAIVEATGNGLLKSILMTVKQRLVHQLVLDYQKWASAGMESDLTVSPLAIDSSGI